MPYGMVTDDPFEAIGRGGYASDAQKPSVSNARTPPPGGGPWPTIPFGGGGDPALTRGMPPNYAPPAGGSSWWTNARPGTADDVNNYRPGMPTGGYGGGNRFTEPVAMPAPEVPGWGGMPKGPSPYGGGGTDAGELFMRALRNGVQGQSTPGYAVPPGPSMQDMMARLRGNGRPSLPLNRVAQPAPYGPAPPPYTPPMTNFTWGW